MSQSILDPRLRYRPIHDTDFRETFGRVREDRARERPVHASPGAPDATEKG